MKRVANAFRFFLVLFSLTEMGYAQGSSKPKLVVGLVVDQMRWDYLYRYADRYGTGGFKRLLRNGFSCENAFIPYTPTYTAAGHACVYTGSVPSLQGIMGNNWYSRQEKRVVYCTEDSSVQAVGSPSAAGKMSPKNLWSTTISDELRLAQNFRNKTIAVALKDRGAILPGGHSANAAYWFDGSVGGFISSTFYMQSLPQWVTAFNAKKLPDAYMKAGWNTLYPIATYTQSTPDNGAYEGNIPGGGNVFPHNTDTITKNKYETFRYLPAANTYTFEMAKAAIEGEGLGKRGVTDLLAISCSSTDYLGHAMTPNSIEIEDMYLRLDRDLAQFLTYLDAVLGRGQYIFFLTADHGAAHNPGFMQQHNIPGGTLDDALLQRRLNAGLQRRFGVPDLISSIINYQVYLADSAIAEKRLDKAAVKKQIIDTLIQIPGIAKAFALENLNDAGLPEMLKMMVANGYNQKLSGDIQFLYYPQWFDGGQKGTTHGTWNPYDAHIPLLWFGWNIKAGRSYRNVYMTDIAPTLAALLHIQMPNANIGTVIEEALSPIP
jgi:predicted AlkP superfamily pyrophosphatase or phosphodiesterase